MGVSLRYLHVSDTHVGFSQHAKLNAHGLNVREQDFFDAFRRAVDIALERRVDFVLHSGDVFDAVRPSNRAVAHVMEQVKRLGEAGIPFVAIAGNHEAPKLRETGSVLRFLDFLPGTHAVYKGRRETVRLGDVAIHAVPHVPSSEGLLAEIDAARPDPAARWNVLAFHAGVIGVADFTGGEFNEVNVPTSALRRDMDDIAVGHYHKATRLAENAWYAGATERTSFKERAEPKGVRLVDLARGTSEFVEIPTRRMLDLPAIECSDLAEVEIAPAILRALGEADLAGAVARLVVRDVPTHVVRTIDHGAIRRLAEAAVHLNVEYERVSTERAPGQAPEAIGGLRAEFGAFMDAAVVPTQKERLKAMGLDYLEAAERGDPA